METYKTHYIGSPKIGNILKNKLTFFINKFVELIVKHNLTF